MPNRWLVKSDPDAYSFADLVRDGETTWDGVANPLALKHIRAMRAGDEVLVYATGKEKAVIGRATVTRDGHGDPAVVDLAAREPLARPVKLAEIKADPFFADFALVRMGRLSVMPVTDAQWKRILALAAA
jgi:predicted RNA-binding protein with PUA-like domain